MPEYREQPVKVMTNIRQQWKDAVLIEAGDDPFLQIPVSAASKASSMTAYVSFGENGNGYWCADNDAYSSYWGNAKLSAYATADEVLPWLQECAHELELIMEAAE